MVQFDPGPHGQVANLLANVPIQAYKAYREHLWFDWAPVLYRGRTDGTARVICIASDPGPTEQVAFRTLVGDAGQRVQGFLRKIGINRSYVCVNAMAYAFRPSHQNQAPAVISDPAIRNWRNNLLDELDSGGQVQAILAFGDNAHRALDQWKPNDPRSFKLVHPSNHSTQLIINSWKPKVPLIKAMILPPEIQPKPNYGMSITESDYAAIPAEDLPFGAPPWLGDSKWLRDQHRNNAVSRSGKKKIVWEAKPAP